MKPAPHRRLLLGGVLDQINAVADRWHRTLEKASEAPHRRRTLRAQANRLEEQLDRLWARYRRTVAYRTRDRFAAIGERAFFNPTR